MGNTLLEGVCIRHNPNDTCLEYEVGFMTTVIKCLSLSYDILNANMTLFKMSLL